MSPCDSPRYTVNNEVKRPLLYTIPRLQLAPPQRPNLPEPSPLLGDADWLSLQV